MFVFDGATPALKLRTVAQRRSMRDRSDVRIRRAAEKLLLNQLHQQAVKQSTDAGETQPASRKRRHSSDASDASDASDELSSDAPKTKAVRIDWASGDEGDSASEEQEKQEPQEPDQDEDEFGVGADITGIDQEVLGKLPVGMQLGILDECREKQRAERHQMFWKAAKAKVTPSQFSDLQVKVFRGYVRVLNISETQVKSYIEHAKLNTQRKKLERSSGEAQV